MSSSWPTSVTRMRYSVDLMKVLTFSKMREKR